MDLLLLNRSIFAAEVRAQASDIKNVIVDEGAQTRAMILDLVQQKGISQATSASYVQSTSTLEVQGSWADGATNAIWKWLLDSLGFPAMKNRQEEIARAYRATFEWIF